VKEYIFLLNKLCPNPSQSPTTAEMKVDCLEKYQPPRLNNPYDLTHHPCRSMV